MSMDHKAFAFDWRSFDSELRPLIEDALSGSGAAKLVQWIDANRQLLTDPYEGDPLPADWALMLGNGDVQEIADFALTKFYDPKRDCGLNGEWLGIDAGLPEDAQNALLGFTIGPEDNLFDPGRMGSFFQTPEQVCESLRLLRGLDLDSLASVIELMEQCAKDTTGLYVTF